MLNVFTKSKPWMVASLLAATSVFGQSKDNAQDKCRPAKACDPMPQMQMMPAYNAPARIDVRGSWDLYAGGSFIYWQARQDNMELGQSVRTSVTTVPVAAGDTTNAYVIAHDFNYKPGFKVFSGINFDHDGWDGYAEYTWFTSNTSTSSNGVKGTTAEPNAFITPLNQNAEVANVAGSQFTSASDKWHLTMQFLDTALARSYHVGTKLTFRSILGARFAWFSQSKNNTFVNDGVFQGTVTTTGTGGEGTLYQHQNFSSWGAGIMAGLNTNWNFGEGFRLIGNGSADICYTRVQTSNSKDSFVNTAATEVTKASVQQPRPDFLMPHMDLELGFGWGSYFDCNNWHIDFLATYGFQVFWNENLFRQNRGYVNETPADVANSSVASGNLYVHGLTATMRIDF